MKTTGEIINSILEEEKTKAATFAKSVGLVPTQIYDLQKGKTKKISDEIADKIISVYPKYNRVWLLTGEGEMLNLGASESNILPTDPILPTNDEQDILLEHLEAPFPRSHYQPIYDIRVCAGQGIGFDGNENKIVKWVAIPDFRGCQGMIVYGDSMYDKYKSGDVIFFRQIFNRNYIENGQPYIVITREDRLLKLLYDDGDPEYITLVSYNVCTNPDGRRTYPDMKVPKEDILFLYKVMGRLERTQI